MSGEETFAARWWRLKRESAEKEGRPPALEGEEKGPAKAEAASGTLEPPFDPATLPPIDSIVADSDIRAFLQKGVPAELTKAALRRVWTADPAIRDFIGIAENQWDFTDPSAIPGFGPLEATGNLPQLVAQAMGELPKVPDAAELPEEPQAGAVHAEAAHAGVVPELQPCADEASGEATASQHPEPAAKAGAAAIRKGHGRALPR